VGPPGSLPLARRSSTRRPSPPAAGAAPFTTTTRSSARYAARCGGSRCLCNPRRTPSHSAKSVEEQRRDEVGTRWGERETQGERRSKGQSAQEAERPQARYRARPSRRTRAGDLRVVVAYLLPALPQRDGHVRGGRAAAPRASLLVRAELAHHIQPGPSHPGTLRNPRRPTDRGILSGGMMKAVSKRFASLCSPIRDSVDGAERTRAPSHQMEADS